MILKLLSQDNHVPRTYWIRHIDQKIDKNGNLIVTVRTAPINSQTQKAPSGLKKYARQIGYSLKYLALITPFAYLEVVFMRQYLKHPGLTSSSAALVMPVVGMHIAKKLLEAYTTILSENVVEDTYAYPYLRGEHTVFTEDHVAVNVKTGENLDSLQSGRTAPTN